MAEMVLRQHHRRFDRWMPRKRRLLTRARGMAVVRALGDMAPGYLLSFAEMLGIPSGLWAAYVTALAALNRDPRFALAGAAAGLVIRAVSGLAVHGGMFVTLAALLFAPLLLHSCSTLRLMLLTALSLLPMAISATLSPTAAQMVQGWACVALAALSAPVFARGCRALSGQKAIGAMEDRISAGYLLAMLICGGARMLLADVNIGCCMAAFSALGAAMELGCGVGAMTGMLSGLVLSLQGLPIVLPVALSFGGFMAGIAQQMGKRKWSCAAFAAACHIPLLLTGTTGLGCGAAVLMASLILMLIPGEPYQKLQRFLRRFLAPEPVPGDAYAAAALTAWERNIAAMARAVPSPRELDAERSPQWWEERLCQGCPECGQCGCMRTELAISKAEAVWQCRTSPEEVWQGALEHLRGMGCQRLYFLLDSMNALRREDETSRAAIRQAEAQRDMLVTHLTAMSGAARRFAMHSGGESWWDDAAARRIRKVLSEHAAPASLTYVRRVQGHVQAAYEVQFISGVRGQAEELSSLTAQVLDAPMQVMSIDGDRIYLAERPPYAVEVGQAVQPITGKKDSGDTVWSGLMQDGSQLIILSDGMGHGEQAALLSRQTVELLRLCMEASYTRQQALTAVNGMLLMGGGGERFATADLLCIDLWNGRASLDKLGASPSYLCQEGNMERLTGESLPLGILEAMDSRAAALRLSPGDTLVLLSDGVEDAFRSQSTLEAAIRSALDEPSAQEAADAILQSALAADDGQRRDDQSAVVIRMHRWRAQMAGLQGRTEPV